MIHVKIRNLSLDVNLVSTFDELKQIFHSAVENNQRGYFVAVNPEKILKTCQDVELNYIYKNSIANFVDGVGVIWAAKLLGYGPVERIMGISFFQYILEEMNGRKLKLFLFGSTSEVLQKMKLNLGHKYPGIEIVGTESGYDYDDEVIMEKINQTQPNVVAVALGSPKQEIWMNDHGMKANSVFIGVGGSFDVYAGMTRRAPEIFQSLGLEWFYRLIAQPTRVKRQRKLLSFVLMVIKEKLT